MVFYLQQLSSGSKIIFNNESAEHDANPKQNYSKDQKPDVLVGKLCSSHQCFISVSELVMNFIALPKPLQNLYGFINSWFWHFDWLEPSFQCWVLLNMLSVFV